MPTVRAIREALVDVSRRYSRVAHEVEDLAHDILLSALRRGLPIDGEAFLRGLHGAVRRHSAFLARSAGRRRAREARAASDRFESGDVEAENAFAEGAPVSALPPALRTTLLLLLSGLEKPELRYVLGVSDAALRKRFQALREKGPFVRPELGKTILPRPRLRRSQVGLLRRLAVVSGEDGQARRMLAASDPDGHGLIFTEVLTPSPWPATSGAASAVNDRTPAKGKSC